MIFMRCLRLPSLCCLRQIYKMVSCKDLTGTVICREYDLDNQAWIDE